MNPAMIMAIAGGVQTVGTILGGIGAQKTAQLRSFDIKTESILSRTQALQQSRIRNDQTKEALSVVQGVFAAAGRDEDGSTKAFREKELEVSGEDISDIEVMSFLNQLKYKGDAAATRRKGRESLFASILKAGSTAASTYSDFKDTA